MVHMNSILLTNVMIILHHNSMMTVGIQSTVFRSLMNKIDSKILLHLLPGSSSSVIIKSLVISLHRPFSVQSQTSDFYPGFHQSNRNIKVNSHARLWFMILKLPFDWFEVLESDFDSQPHASTQAGIVFFGKNSSRLTLSIQHHIKIATLSR